MKKLSFIVSLPTLENDYQQQQAKEAERIGANLGVDITVFDSYNDSITQTLELLKIVQSKSEPRPDAIIVEPSGGTAFPQVANAAVSSGMGWVVLNRNADYIPHLRSASKVPVFCLGPDHTEIGRLQGKQLAALLPQGGSVLYIEGPAASSSAKKRHSGTLETKPTIIQLFRMNAHWTEQSAFNVVSRWLRLPTSRETAIQAIAGQDDSMAMGARRAIEESLSGVDRERWLSLPFLGCDGVLETGQAWVRKGLLRATVISPANTRPAIEMLVSWLRTGTVQPPYSSTKPTSYPPAETLTPIAKAQSI
ncbi:MAG TPA: substrate-binding domain-containing protein [Terriglobales bacterium]|jgi:ABC-type sugar transport system substrate-binding protein